MRELIRRRFNSDMRTPAHRRVDVSDRRANFANSCDFEPITWPTAFRQRVGDCFRALLRDLQIGVRITDGALVAAATLSNRYITDRFLPDKAIDLMDEAGSRLRMQVDSKPEALDELDRRVIQLKIEREALRKESDAASRERCRTAASTFLQDNLPSPGFWTFPAQPFCLFLKARPAERMIFGQKFFQRPVANVLAEKHQTRQKELGRRRSGRGRNGARRRGRPGVPGSSPGPVRVPVQEAHGDRQDLHPRRPAVRPRGVVRVRPPVPQE